MNICINNKKLKIGLIAFILYRILVFGLNEKFDLYLMIFGVNQWIINLLVDVLIIITVDMLILHKKEMLLGVMIFLSVICIVLLLFINLMMHSNKSYFHFKSPDRSHTLVVEEDSFLLGGWSNFYERRGLIFIKDLKQQIMTDDGYTPFSCNDYELNWLDNNSVEIIYGFGNEYNTYKKELIRFD